MLFALPMNVIRRPVVSDNGPQNDGATAWAIMYTVTVRLRTDKSTLISYQYISSILLQRAHAYPRYLTQSREVYVCRQGREHPCDGSKVHQRLLLSGREDVVGWLRDLLMESVAQASHWMLWLTCRRRSTRIKVLRSLISVEVM
jgi:hypothetical protein